MTIFQWLVIFKFVTIVFGSGYLRRFILFECKYLGGVYFNSWRTIEHDRFHTHAFSSLVFILSGEYYEEQLHPDGNISLHVWKGPCMRYIPRSNNHRMLMAKRHTYSIGITGPWDLIWSETLYPSMKKRFLTWGRKVLHEEK